MEIKKSENGFVSVIIPVYNEQESVLELHRQIATTFSGLPLTYEILFIDDGSTDGTLEKIKMIQADNVRAISLQRNFGKAAALSCGFLNAGGDLVITMDGDLQDDPSEIPKFIEALEKYDVVSGWKQNRQDPVSKLVPSIIFNWLTSFISGIKINDFNSGYKGYRKNVVRNMSIYGELHRYIPVIASWKGFSIGEIRVQHRPRTYGRSKYGMGRLARGFLDLITVKFLTSYTQRPLHLFGGIGFALSTVGGLICLYLLILWLYGTKIGNRPLLLLGVLLIITGIQFVAIGLVGELIVSLSDKRNWIIKSES